MNSWMLTLLQCIFVLLIAPLSIGLVRLFKARLQGRHGASPFLPYITLATLLKKQMVISTSTSWVFRVVPFVVLGTNLFLVFVLPLIVTGSAGGSFSNIFVVAGVLAIGALFLVLGGLDSASAFGGMGASREMTLASLLEPVVVATFGAFAIASGSSMLNDSLLVGGQGLLSNPALIFSVLALILIIAAENARYPVDNPATHLELTMVHEAMVLEYSGPYLALLEYASAIKLCVLSLFISNIVFPMTVIAPQASAVAILLGLIFAVVKLVVCMGLLALLETTIAKMRFYRMQEFMTSAFFLALGGLILVLFHSL
ncbi:MAG: NADH-quinone oxidoreductase subunit H [Patescibacteria group bacterium]